MRKIFLETLPYSTRSGGKIINWKKSIGEKVNFIYDEIEGEFEIINYTEGKIKIKYNDIEYDTTTNSLRNNGLYQVLGFRTGDFKIEIGQIFKNDKVDIEIIDREYRVDKNGIKRKWYKYKCKKCPNEDWIVEDCLFRNYGCNVCTVNGNKKVLKGYNDIATTDSWMCKYIVNEEDWYKYSSNSGKRILMKCPYCGEEKTYKIQDLFESKKLPCKCGDNIKYPEKFMVSFLNQLGVKYIWQYSKCNCDWIEKDKRYDFYFKINNEEYIVEVNGLQHYEESFKKISKRTLQEEKDNDKYKYNTAIKNGIKPKNYVVIDFRYSTLEWGKEHILNSRLNEIFDLSDIDWEQCEKYALKNIVKEVCDYWHEHVEVNKEKLNLKKLSHIFCLNRDTIGKYLNKGYKLGWCNYVIGSENNRKSNGKTIIVKNIETKECWEFDSIASIEKNSEEIIGIKFLKENIHKVLNGKWKQYKGFVFKYKEVKVNEKL